MESPTTQIKTEYLMTLHAPLEAGQPAGPDLSIYNVLPGGWARGPRIRGEIIAPSGDWLRIMPDGKTAKLDVRDLAPFRWSRT